MTPNETTPALAERYVLSAMMLNVDAVWAVIDIMPGLQMLEPRHETIAQTIRTLADRGDPVDPIAVVDELERTGELNRIGGPAYIHALTSEAVTWVNVAYYAEIVHRAGIRARLHAVAEQIKHVAADPTQDVYEVGERARAAIDHALNLDDTEDEEDLSRVFMDLVDQIGTTSPGYPTPFPQLTQRLSGLAPGSVYVLAARPSVGKSLIALQFATELEQHGYVAYFSYEMTRKENRLRQLSQLTDIALNRMRSGARLNDLDETAAREFAARQVSRILYSDRGSETIHDIRHKVRTWHRKYKLSGIVIDYLQLIVPTTSGENRNQQIAEISRNVKLMAREYELPVILLSQMNRGIDHRVDKTPGLADLRDSGTIEQDADVVMFLDDSGTDALDRMFNEETALDILIAKNRNGPTGIVSLNLERANVRAYEAPDQDRRRHSGD